MIVIQRDLAGRDARGLPNLVRAGPFLFTRACDGDSGGIADQCERAYGAVRDILAAAQLDLDRVVRLDHFTESQGWLAERQAVRARFFGRPAPLASTGVASRLRPPNCLRVAAIAVAPGVEKVVLVDGASFGMAAISSVVMAGSYLFLSGILNDGGERFLRRAGESEAMRQARGCFATIAALLQRAGCTPSDVLRQDVYLHEAEEADTAAAVLALAQAPARHGAFLPFGGADRLEVTTIARRAGAGEGPLVFLSAQGKTPQTLLQDLRANLLHANLAPDRLLRLDLCSPDHGREEDLVEAVAASFGAAAPVVVPLSGRSLTAAPLTASAIVAR